MPLEFPISREMEGKILNEILSGFTKGISPITKPQFFLVMGQPGAGKTEIIVQIKASVKNNILVCNADDLRKYHPDIDIILRDHEDRFSEITWPYAEEWNRELLSVGVMKRLNIIVETTGRDIILILETLKQRKTEGYTTHLHLLAIPPYISWLGIRLRYESAKYLGNQSRTVSDADHDQRCENLLMKIPDIISSPDLDELAVFTRKPLIRATENTAIHLLTRKETDAVTAFHSAFGKKMDLEEKTVFLQCCRSVIDYMQKRGADIELINAFKTQVNEKEQQYSDSNL